MQYDLIARSDFRRRLTTDFNFYVTHINTCFICVELMRLVIPDSATLIRLSRFRACREPCAHHPKKSLVSSISRIHFFLLFNLFLFRHTHIWDEPCALRSHLRGSGKPRDVGMEQSEKLERNNENAPEGRSSPRSIPPACTFVQAKAFRTLSAKKMRNYTC